MWSTVWVGLCVKGGREERLRALRAARSHTVGYIGGCDEEQGELECPCHELLFAFNLTLMAARPILMAAVTFGSLCPPLSRSVAILQVFAPTMTNLMDLYRTPSVST